MRDAGSCHSAAFGAPGGKLLYSCICKYSEAYQETVWFRRIEQRSTNSRNFPFQMMVSQGSSQGWATKRFWVSSEGCTEMNAIFRQMLSHCWSNTKLMWNELEWRSCKNAKVFIYCNLRIPSNKEFCMQTLGQRRLISGIKRHKFFFWSSCYLLSLVLEVLVCLWLALLIYVSAFSLGLLLKSAGFDLCLFLLTTKAWFCFLTVKFWQRHSTLQQHIGFHWFVLYKSPQAFSKQQLFSLFRIAEIHKLLAGLKLFV